MLTVCRNDELRVTRQDSSLTIELCLDDAWLTISNSLQFSTHGFIPRNLELNASRQESQEGLSVSWEAPELDSGEIIVGYDIICAEERSGIQQSPQQRSSESLTVNGNINNAFVAITATQPIDYSCCITSHIQRGVLTYLSLPECGAYQFIPSSDNSSSVSATSSPTVQRESDFMLVLILGILVGAFFMEIIVMCIALLVFMSGHKENGKRKKKQSKNSKKYLDQESEPV